MSFTPPTAQHDDEIDDSVLPSGEIKPNVNWEKVLWRHQPYPDNYVPPSFLSELKDLFSRPRPRLVSLIWAVLPVSQHLAVIALFLAVFYRLLVYDLGPGQVGWGCVVFGFVGFGIHRWGWGHSYPRRSDPTSTLLPAPTPLRPLILPPLLLSLLSPVLGTLTSATTSDSIWPLAGGLFFLHLLLADFRTGTDARLRRREMKRREERKRRGSIGREEPIAEEKSLTSSLSLTSALSASVVLASRLPSTAHVFSLVLLAAGAFAGWPAIAKGVRVRRRNQYPADPIQEAGKIFSIALTTSMLLLAISFFPTESPVPILIFLPTIALVNLLGPVMLHFAWQWKTHRGGGWDVAVVRLNKKAKAEG